MIRLAGWIAAGLVLGAIVHFATVLALPATATRTSFARLAAFTEVNKVALLPQPSPNDAILPLMDPAFATAVCRYDLTAGALKVRMPVMPAYGSMTFYTRGGIAYYAINDRGAGRRMVELELMTPEQRSALELDEDETAADRLIIQAATPTGLIAFRAFAPEPSNMPVVRGALNASECALQAPAKN